MDFSTIIPRLIFLLNFAKAYNEPYVASKMIRLEDESPIIGRRSFSTSGKKVVEYLGIPYAEPPIGNLRFQRPKTKTKWTDVLNASTLPNSCAQNRDTYFDDWHFYGAEMWNPNTPISEDCLYLNIWVPVVDFNDARGRHYAQQLLPVMVWVYGGGFWSGSSTLQVYDGKTLSTEEQVIIVSMNYRLNLFGFMYLGLKDHAQGNMGLLDQLEALKWVHRNIRKFGGDPNLVTLFGESAGAGSVSLHSLSPLSQQYFKRFILQSGAAGAPWGSTSKNVALNRTMRLAEAVKCWPRPEREDTLKCLMSKSTQELLDNEPMQTDFVDLTWMPVVDGYFLPEKPNLLLADGKFQRKECIVGTNSHEAFYFIVYYLNQSFPREKLFNETKFVHDDDQYNLDAIALLPTRIRDNAVLLRAVLQEYGNYELPVTPMQRQLNLDKLAGDLYFTCPVLDFAQKFHSGGGKVYEYLFAHRASAQTWPEWMGVLHGYEINFVFGEPFNTSFKYTTKEKDLSARFMRFWANFARTGNPNLNPDGSSMPDSWPKYNKTSQEYLILSLENSIYTGRALRHRQCTFWKMLIPYLYDVTKNLSDVEINWKQEFSRWQNEYIVDWKNQFEQYKMMQMYNKNDAGCHR